MYKILINNINEPSILDPSNDLNNKVGTCKFEAIYNDVEDEERFKRWACKEKTDNSRIGNSIIFCAFHDKTKSEWDDNTFARFRAKVQEAIDKGTALYCIGYHFPTNISFKLLLPLDSDQPHCQRYPSSEIPIEHDTRRRISNIPIYLCDADFGGQVEFSHCKFEQTLNLSGAIFRREVLFRKTIFNGKFYPRRTEFCGNVNFRWAQFQEADFHDTIFKDKANFRQSIFIKTMFRNAKFEDKVNFVHSKFYGETGFLGTTFSEAFFSPDVIFEGKTKFKYVVFENGERVVFATKDLKNVSFMDTDITRVKFSDDVKWGGKDKCTVIDEIELVESAHDGKKIYTEYSNIDSIKAIYRNLRENYEYRLRYDEAGQFFFREMELKRNYHQDPGKQIIKRTDRFRRNISLTGFYRLASYGEKVRMPFLLMGITIFISLITSLYYLYPTYYPSFDYEGLAPLGNATERSFTTFLQLRNENFTWIDYISKVFGILSLGLLAIPLRRKFERKFRH